MKKLINLSSLSITILIFFISSISYSANYTIYSSFADFQSGLGGQSPLTQNFDGYTEGEDLNGIAFLPKVAATSNMDTITAWGSGSDKNLFARDTVQPNTRATETRTYYDINFTLPYSAVGFNIDVWDPDANGPGRIEVFFQDSTSFSVDLDQTSGSESIPVFFGIIADTPIVRIRWNEPPEKGEAPAGWEETALDDFAVAASGCPANYTFQPSYAEDCLLRPEGSVCAVYDDEFTWLIWDAVADWSTTENIQIAHGFCGDYYHILDTNCVRLVGPDIDGDLVPDGCDNCPGDANDDQADADTDGIGDVCDNCPESENSDQLDTDRDKIGDLCDDDDDNDTILDAADNCTLVFNIDQANKDGDNYGDACDNCPDTPNNEQADSDNDGLGDACEDFNENLDVPAGPIRPGEPLWVTATFINNTTQPIETMRPDCFNTTFTVTNPAGIILNPRYRIRQAYGIPKDLVLIPPGPFNVTCNVADMFDKRVLASGPAGSPISYDMVATYSNDHLDPDIVNGVCTDPTGECYDQIWTGEVSSTTQSVTIEGSPVTTVAADVVFAPDVWVAQWASFNSPPILAQISNVEGHAITDIDPSTILQNGTVPIIDGSSSINNGVLMVLFDRSLAVQSLGTAVPGIYFPAIQGEFNNGSTDIFYGEGRVEIVGAIDVEIDIKPGSFPNSINLKSKGKVPVAIFSTPEFDATTIDPGTVTLAGAGVAVKGKGKRNRLMASFEDKNNDGRMDLVVHVCTQALQISKSDRHAVLEGKTYDNIPIIGSDSIRIVPRKWSTHKKLVINKFLFLEKKRK
jgi:hypothetical protein